MGEEDLGVGGFAGEDAGAGGGGLVEGDAADGGFGFVLDAFFDGFVGFEVAADEAAVFGEDGLHLVVGCGGAGAGELEGTGFFEEEGVGGVELLLEEVFGEGG